MIKLIYLSLIFWLNYAFGMSPNFDILPGAITTAISANPTDKQKNQTKDSTNLIYKWESQFQKTTNPNSSDPIRMANGSGTRGGGSGIARYQGEKIIDVILLDLYRKNQIDRKFYSQLINKWSKFLCDNRCSENSTELMSELILNETIDGIEKYFPILAKRLKMVLPKVGKQTWTSTSVELPLLNDFGDPIFLTENDHQVQIAYRRSTYVIYNQKYYVSMDSINRAALKLHELFYAISGFRESRAIQDVVAHFLSQNFQDKSVRATTKQLLINLDLEFLSVESLNLPKGIELIKSKNYKPNEVCGLLTEMTLNKVSKTLQLQINADLTRPHITHEDFNVNSLNQLSQYNLNPINLFNKFNLELTNDELSNFILTIYRLKFYLTGQFPIFEFPLQSTPNDIICFNQNNNKIVSLSSTLLFKKKLNAQELIASSKEVRYLSLFKEPISLRSLDENLEIKELEEYFRRLKVIEVSANTVKTPEQRVKNLIDLLFDTETLGTVTVDFNN